MSSSDEKLDLVLQKLDRIEKALKIVPDRDSRISDFDSSIEQYKKFAKEDLSLQDVTIENHVSTISAFLEHSTGIINKDTVNAFLDTNDSPAWKSNQVKALRRYIRDFLKLGTWIEEFKFSKARAKPKEIPSDNDLIDFFNLLSYQVKIIFLVLYTSGLRLGEVLELNEFDIDLIDTRMINASKIHKGDTKSSWISFVTKQTAEFLSEYLDRKGRTTNPKLFTISARTVQHEFKEASLTMGLEITPHLLRTMFAEKCARAGVKDKYIDAFCGRISHGVLATHYTDYSPSKLREEYEKVEPLLILGERSIS